MDMALGNGNIDRLGQLLEVNTTSYSVTNYNSHGGISRYISKEHDKEKIIKVEDILGVWSSHNSLEKIYRKYLPGVAIESGIIELFEGDLLLSVTKDKLSYMIDSLEPLEYGWQLGKDGRVLVLEYQIDEPETKGVHFEYADIMELTGNTMKIRLFDNNYFTGIEQPSRYMLNLIQEFERIE